ncbi:hypothetical protein [Streptomyces sp. NPDC090025]|uniref:hypothetical protein n=1 Tax=Streptomyces sp. NPDC090025 TaxID=3365922 RepID=UPI0038375395
MTVPALRPLLSTAATALLVGSVSLAGAPFAHAAPGDNGDVKIHKAGSDPDKTNDEPKVCRFYLDAFNFDSVQKVDWEINPQPPKADSPNLSGHLNLTSGKGHTSDLFLPDGMYKLDWTFEGQNGSAKHKVFKVDCGTIASPPPTTGGNGNGGNGNGGNGNGGNGNGGSGNGGASGGNGHPKPPHGPVGAGGGGAADPTAPADDSAAFGIGSAVAAGLAGTAGLILIRRSRRRDHGAA